MSCLKTAAVIFTSSQKPLGLYMDVVHDELHQHSGYEQVLLSFIDF